MKFHVHIVDDPTFPDGVIVSIREGDRWGEGEVLATRTERGNRGYEGRSAWINLTVEEEDEDCSTEAWYNTMPHARTL